MPQAATPSRGGGDAQASASGESSVVRAIPHSGDPRISAPSSSVGPVVCVPGLRACATTTPTPEAAGITRTKDQAGPRASPRGASLSSMSSIGVKEHANGPEAGRSSMARRVQILVAANEVKRVTQREKTASTVDPCGEHGTACAQRTRKQRAETHEWTVPPGSFPATPPHAVGAGMGPGAPRRRQPSHVGWPAGGGKGFPEEATPSSVAG